MMDEYRYSRSRHGLRKSGGRKSQGQNDAKFRGKFRIRKWNIFTRASFDYDLGFSPKQTGKFRNIFSYPALFQRSGIRELFQN